MVKLFMDIKNKELHRVVTTALIYKPASPAGRPDLAYLVVKRALNKIFPGKWTIPGGGLSTDDYILNKRK